MYDMTKSVKSVSVVKMVDEVVPILFSLRLLCVVEVERASFMA